MGSYNKRNFRKMTELNKKREIPKQNEVELFHNKKERSIRITQENNKNS